MLAMIRAEYLALAFGVSEIALNVRKRARRVGGESRDAGTLRLVWTAIVVATIGSIVIKDRVEFGRFGLGPMQQIAVLAVLIAGIALRWWAIAVLGRFFTVDVAIHADHHVVSSGPYAVLRHPSYTGALLAFVAIGLTFGSWPALAVLVIPILVALVVRIRVEERALDGALGDAWRVYAAKTSRLVPFLW
jgi:protein-S-isoprenylcysteine O-methyltransferase